MTQAKADVIILSDGTVVPRERITVCPPASENDVKWGQPAVVASSQAPHWVTYDEEDHQWQDQVCLRAHQTRNWGRLALKG